MTDFTIRPVTSEEYPAFVEALIDGFGDDLPYAIALLDYGDYKVFGRIARDVPENAIQVGMEMTTKVNRLPNGQLNYVFQKA